MEFPTWERPPLARIARDNAIDTSCGDEAICASPNHDATSSKSSDLAQFTAQFNEEQLTAILGRTTACVILAGPGSGKTRTIVGRMSYFLRYQQQHRPGTPNVHFRKILGLTFTNKAAREMGERVAAESCGARSNTEQTTNKKHTDQVGLPLICTYHGLCARLLRQYGSRVGIDPSFCICDSSTKILKSILGNSESTSAAAAAADDRSGETGSVDEVSNKSIASKVSSMKRVEFAEYAIANFKFPPAIQKATLNLTQRSNATNRKRSSALVSNVVTRYNRRLRSQNMLDFDDLLIHTVKLLIDHPDVRRIVSERWTHLFVDEFQDSSLLQLQLVFLLFCGHHDMAGPKQQPPVPSVGRFITIVGDPNQSIYSWRFACSTIFDTFFAAFQQSLINVERVRLTQNYRSTQSVVSAAAAVLGSGARNAATGKLWTSKGCGNAVEYHTFSDSSAEAEFVSALAASFKASGSNKPRSCAILYRMASLSTLIERELVLKDVPYNMLGGATQLSQRREIQALRCHLNILVNPVDDFQFLAGCSVPKIGLGPKTQSKLQLCADEVGISCYAWCMRALVIGDPTLQVPKSLLNSKVKSSLAARVQFIVDCRQSLHRTIMRSVGRKSPNRTDDNCFDASDQARLGMAVHKVVMVYLTKVGLFDYISGLARKHAQTKFQETDAHDGQSIDELVAQEEEKRVQRVRLYLSAVQTLSDFHESAAASGALCPDLLAFEKQCRTTSNFFASRKSSKLIAQHHVVPRPLKKKRAVTHNTKAKAKSNSPPNSISRLFARTRSVPKIPLSKAPNECQASGHSADLCTHGQGPDCTQCQSLTRVPVSKQSTQEKTWLDQRKEYWKALRKKRKSAANTCAKGSQRITSKVRKPHKSSAKTSGAIVRVHADDSPQHKVELWRRICYDDEMSSDDDFEEDPPRRGKRRTDRPTKAKLEYPLANSSIRPSVCAANGANRRPVRTSTPPQPTTDVRSTSSTRTQPVAVDPKDTMDTSKGAINGLGWLLQFLQASSLDSTSVETVSAVQSVGGMGTLSRFSLTLGTIHAAKGLEWDNVVIVGVEDEILPHVRSGMDGGDEVNHTVEFGRNSAESVREAEERRLLYVGMTRARRRLWLTRAKRRQLFGEFRRHDVCPFLEQLLQPRGIFADMVKIVTHEDAKKDDHKLSRGRDVNALDEFPAFVSASHLWAKSGHTPDTQSQLMTQLPISTSVGQSRPSLVEAARTRALQQQVQLAPKAASTWSQFVDQPRRRIKRPTSELDSDARRRSAGCNGRPVSKIKKKRFAGGFSALVASKPFNPPSRRRR